MIWYCFFISGTKFPKNAQVNKKEKEMKSIREEVKKEKELESFDSVLFELLYEVLRYSRYLQESFFLLRIVTHFILLPCFNSYRAYYNTKKFKAAINPYSAKR